MASTEVEEPPPDVNTPPAETPHGVRGPMRIVYFLLAGVFFALAALGAVLPGLPTTPFLLLTSYFLVRCSPRCNRILLRSRFFGPILRDWQQHRGVRRNVKSQAIGMVIVVVAASWYFSRPGPAMLASILVAAGIGIAVVVMLPAVKD